MNLSTSFACELAKLDCFHAKRIGQKAPRHGKIIVQSKLAESSLPGKELPVIVYQQFNRAFGLRGPKIGNDLRMAKMLKQLGERMLNLTVSAQWLPLRFQEISDSLLINLPN